MLSIHKEHVLSFKSSPLQHVVCSALSNLMFDDKDTNIHWMSDHPLLIVQLNSKLHFAVSNVLQFFVFSAKIPAKSKCFTVLLP